MSKWNDKSDSYHYLLLLTDEDILTPSFLSKKNIISDRMIEKPRSHADPCIILNSYKPPKVTYDK